MIFNLEKVVTMKTVFGYIDKNIDGRNRTFLKAIAMVEEDRLAEIENHYEEFPNNGKIFVPNHMVEEYSGNLGFYSIIESRTFDENILSSSKYVVSHEVPSIGFYEIVKVPYSLDGNKEEVINVIQNGLLINSDISLTSKILLLTEDMYLIGPYSVKLDKNKMWVGEIFDNGLLEVRNSNEQFIEYHDDNIGASRNFFSPVAANTPAEEFLDCSTDERIVREALKIVKEENNVEGISRAVIKSLAHMVNQMPASVRKERVSKAAQILKDHLISRDDINKFEQELIDNDTVEYFINQNVEEIIVEEVKKLEETHSKTINEVNRLKKKKAMFNKELKEMEEMKEYLNEDIKKANIALENKLEEMKENVFNTFLDLLPSTASFSPEEEQVTIKPSSSQWVVQENELKESCIKDVKSLLNNLIYNLEKMKIKQEAPLIAQTVLGAILFRQPLIVTGENSFDISQLIGWTISGNDHITIFPEIQGYSNEALVSTFYNFKRTESFKSMHVSSIESSAAELYLPSFVDYWKVSTEGNYPDLLMISVKELEELSNTFVSKLKYSPVVNTGNLGTKGQLRKMRRNQETIFGFTNFNEILEESEFLSKKSKTFKEVKEILEENTELNPSRIKDYFKDWFCLFENGSFTEGELTNWLIRSLLKVYIDQDEYKLVLEELDFEENLVLK
jgi:hypothetical protein